MIAPDHLEKLRCPLDPQRATLLVDQEHHLVCPRCGVKFPMKDGFPVLVVEEAELPPDCENLDRLSSRHVS